MPNDFCVAKAYFWLRAQRLNAGGAADQIWLFQDAKPMTLLSFDETDIGRSLLRLETSVHVAAAFYVQDGDIRKYCEPMSDVLANVQTVRTLLLEMSAQMRVQGRQLGEALSKALEEAKSGDFSRLENIEREFNQRGIVY
jgi:hypothetical protein